MARERDAFYSEHSLLDVIQIGSKEADHRHARGIRHSLSSMLTILLVGFLLGKTTIRGICRYFSFKEQRAMLESFLKKPLLMTDEQVYDVLKTAFGQPEVQAKETILLKQEIASINWRTSENKASSE